MNVNRTIAIATILIVLAILLCALIIWGLQSEQETCGRPITRCDTIRLVPPSNLKVTQSGNWTATWDEVPDAKSYEVVINTTLGTVSKIVTGTNCEFILKPEEIPPDNPITVRVMSRLDECNLKSNPSIFSLP